ncbi:MAG: zinc-dependent alcohol dehydrogenase [Candidatus Dormibacteria bacterium]
MPVLALVFDPSPGRLPLAAVASRIHPLWALRGPAPLTLREIPEPRPPSPEWVRLRVLRTGICGSDVAQALLRASSDNPLSGLVSFPHVPGHEIVAEVAEAGSELSPPTGSLVAVDPWLGCRARGLTRLCPACRAGFPPHCAAVLDGGPWGSGRGMHLGNVRDLPGGFTATIFAHPSQLHAIPAGLRPELAVLADPLAVGLHALEQVKAEPRGPILVLGAGTIGLSLVLAARSRWPAAEILATTAWGHQRSVVAERGGEPLPAALETVVEMVSARTGARLVRPWRGGPWCAGAGAALVLDSIGSSATIELGLRALAPAGQVVRVGVAQPARTETTLAYYKEALVTGSNGYGLSRLQPGSPHLLDVALGLLASHGEVARAWLTHTFPLSRWREGFEAAARPDHSGAIKVTLQLEENRPG